MSLLFELMILVLWLRKACQTSRRHSLSSTTEENRKMNSASVMKLTGMFLLTIGMATAVSAVPAAPEIDAATGINAVALLSGVLLIIRSRKR